MPKEHVAAEKALPFNTLQHITQLIRKSGMVLIFFVMAKMPLQAQSNTYQLRTGMDLGIALGSSGVFTTSYLLQKKVEPLSQTSILQLNRNSINTFDRIATHQWNPGVAKVSDGVAVGAILMQSYFYFNKTTRPDAFKIGVVSFESFMLSQSIANALKLTKRNRPFLYNQAVPMEVKLKSDARMSFFSAHTTTVSSMCFSFAFTHQYYMPQSKYNQGIWISAFTLPAVEGFLRVKAGKHYPTDVITGYLVGLGSAYLMHQLHKN